MRYSLASMALLFLVAGNVLATDCGVFFRRSVAVQSYAVPVVTGHVSRKVAVAAQPLYQVGTGLQNQAERERIENNAVARYRQGLADGLKIAGGNVQQLVQDLKPSVVQQKCGSCHSGNAPKGGLLLGSGVKYSPGQITKALRILSGDNVPTEMESVIKGLKPEDQAAIMQELLNNEG